MSKLHTEDTFMFENQLIDDFEEYPTYDAVTIGAEIIDLTQDHNPVDNPSHYNSGNIECIKAIEEALTDDELRGYFKGNCLKYLWREQYKNQLEDLKKADWYLTRLIKNLEANGDN